MLNLFSLLEIDLVFGFQENIQREKQREMETSGFISRITESLMLQLSLAQFIVTISL